MGTKEIYISVSYPYQLSQYLNGKIEIGETIVLEDDEEPAQIQSDTIKRLITKCKEEAHNIIISEQTEEKVVERGERKRREF